MGKPLEGAHERLLRDVLSLGRQPRAEHARGDMKHAARCRVISMVDESLPSADVEPDWLVRRAVEELPAVPRAVLHLHYWLGHTVEEIAALLSMPPNTVKSHLARGRHRVAARLKERP